MEHERYSAERALLDDIEAAHPEAHGRIASLREALTENTILREERDGMQKALVQVLRMVRSLEKKLTQAQKETP